ncbi:DUF262 domain-containing protein [Thalassospira lucentensis]|uniref:DUF262 domain-containing protein n=1 Tax=Thalassospira lucentensis TaxID=168935 RepID=UPI0003B6C11C|nr:DUF262 domain-containing protein [Thalassospira lucentensis]RCK27758.1 hypothetical protein TH1_10815 [Thalassospira lucentensis MCCC 1A00383 = DSM 14000]
MTRGENQSLQAALSFRPSQTTISALFGGFGTLSVPDFQRDYAWDDAAVSVFIDDVERCRRRRQASTPLPHFFGAVVTSPGEVSGTSRPHLIIIDGQQRLATVFMLITTLRRQYQRAETTARGSGDAEELAVYFGARAENLTHAFECAQDIEFKSQKSVRKLILNKADDPFFARLLAQEDRTPTRASHKRLEKANSAIESYLNELQSRAENQEDIRRILDSLYVVFLKDWLIVQLAAGTDREANRIYRVLNSRGVPVTNTDLLRASTLELAAKKLENNDIDAMAQDWDVILAATQLGPDDALDAAFYSRTGIARQKNAPIDQLEEELFPLLQSDEKPTTEEAQEVFRTVGQLRRDVEQLSTIASGQICQPAHDRFTPVFRSRFDALTAVLNQSYCIPFLHAAACLEPRAYVSVCDLVERFSFRYGVVIRAPIHALEPVFEAHIRTLRANPRDFRISDLKGDLTTLISAYAGNDLFKERLLNLEYGRDTRKPLRYALVMIEHMSRWYGENPQGTPTCRDVTRVIDFRSITLEHIEASNSVNLDPQLTPYINSLGNLTVMSQAENDAVANKSFEQKKKVFSKSDLAINRAIAEYDTWNLESFKTRQQDLLDQCMAIFSI